MPKKATYVCNKCYMPTSETDLDCRELQLCKPCYNKQTKVKKLTSGEESNLELTVIEEAVKRRINKRDDPQFAALQINSDLYSKNIMWGSLNIGK